MHLLFVIVVMIAELNKLFIHVPERNNIFFDRSRSYIFCCLIIVFLFYENIYQIESHQISREIAFTILISSVCMFYLKIICFKIIHLMDKYGQLEMHTLQNIVRLIPTTCCLSLTIN